MITTDKNTVYPKAIAKLKTAELLPESCELRYVKYLNNLIEQDHRFIVSLSVLHDGYAEPSGQASLAAHRGGS